MKGSTIAAVVILGAVGIIAYLFLGNKGGASPSLSAPQSGQIESAPSASSYASGNGLSLTEVYNYAPSSISESSHIYQTTIAPNTKAGLINF